MKAAVFYKPGGPEVIEFVELPDPVIGPDEVIIRTEVIGLNFADINRRRGIYKVEGTAPFILGYEGAGVVVEVGSQVKDFVVGARVAFAHVPFANAELVKAPAWKVIPLPEDISFESAATLLLQGLTAYYLTHESYAIKPHERVLIHSASGGVGLLLTQICRNLGAYVVGTVSTQDKAPLAHAAGAHQVIIRSHNWHKEVQVDVSYDAIGTTLLETLQATKALGTVVYYGQAGGQVPLVDPNLLMADSKALVGGELWTHIGTKESLLKKSCVLFTWLRENRISLHSVTKFPLCQTAQAHAVLESGQSQGKILLITG